MPEHPDVWTDGSREDFSSIGGFEIAGAGVFLPASRLLLKVRFGERQRSMVMLVWSVVVLLCLFLGSCRLFSVLNSGVLLLLCSPSCLVTCWVNWQAVGPWLLIQTSAFGQRWRFDRSCLLYDPY